jgi:SAM-dependent methyltransferase
MTEQVAQHYGKGGLLDRILAALAEAGKDIEHLTIDDLAPIDEFHSRRRLATEELATLLAPSDTDHVIDIGSGLGGPSRYLATTFGCRVSGVDLTPEFVETATALTSRVGLTDRVDFRIGSALEPHSLIPASTAHGRRRDRPELGGEGASCRDRPATTGNFNSRLRLSREVRLWRRRSVLQLFTPRFWTVSLPSGDDITATAAGCRSGYASTDIIDR